MRLFETSPAKLRERRVIHPDDPNPFAHLIVDRSEINWVAAVCIIAALGLVGWLFVELLT
jgi:hypothetical protein